jgi:hypothetical protein
VKFRGTYTIELVQTNLGRGGQRWNFQVLSKTIERTGIDDASFIVMGDVAQHSVLELLRRGDLSDKPTNLSPRERAKGWVLRFLFAGNPLPADVFAACERKNITPLGARKAADVEAASRKEDINKRTLARVKGEIAIPSVQPTSQGEWWWVLPQSPEIDVEALQEEEDRLITEAAERDMSEQAAAAQRRERQRRQQNEQDEPQGEQQQDN